MKKPNTTKTPGEVNNNACQVSDCLQSLDHR